MSSNNVVDFFEKDLNKPFYKRRLFIFGVGLCVVTVSIVIIIVVASSKPSSSPDSSTTPDSSKTPDSSNPSDSSTPSDSPTPSTPTKLFEHNYISNSFSESKEFVKNPDQGFYRPVVVTIKPDSLSHQTNYPEQVYHLRCDISQFSGKVNSDGKDKSLTETALNELEKYLDEIKKEQKNAIIRFAYDPNYGGKTNKEPELSMIEEHIKQLGPVLEKHADVLTAIEAGMLGPWGEMHTSTIATEKNKGTVLKYWLDNTKILPILARTPRMIFAYFNKNLAQMEQVKITKDDKEYRLGAFNDCFLSSADDVGTYDSRQREINWLANQTDHLPFGGEVCAVDKMNNLENALPELYLLSASYFNIEYEEDVIVKKWKEIYYDSSLGSESLFYGSTAYDFINAHLGYRLVIKSVNISYNKGGDYNMDINIQNKGFGNLTKEKNVDIIFADKDNKVISRKNLAKYKGEDTLSISGNLLDKNSEDYNIYLCIYSTIENNVIYYPIQFANANVYNNNLKANLLLKVKQGGEIIS